MNSSSILNLIVFFSIVVLEFVAVFFIACRECLTAVVTRDFDLPTEDEKCFGLKSAKKIINNVDFYSIVSSLGIVVSLIAVGGLVSLTASHMLWGILFGLLAAVIFTVITQLVQTYVSQKPEKFLCFCAPVFFLVAWFITPIAIVTRGLRKCLLSLFKLQFSSVTVAPASPEDLSLMVVRSSEAGELEEEQGEMIQGVIEFSDSIVREVMTPRKDVVAISEKSTLKDILLVFRRERLSRILVIGNELDDVKGILIIKDLVPLLTEPEHVFDMGSYIRPVHSVLETMKTDELLAELQELAEHFAVVLDEHGGVAGVVTVEDLVEEIVGEIFDEYDVPEEEIDTTLTKDGDLIVDGGTLIDDLNTEYGFDFPEGEYDTIAGLVMNCLGKIPTVNEKLECNGFTIMVEAMKGNRIELLRIVNVQDFLFEKKEEVSN